MATFVRKVDRSIPRILRNAEFTQADVSTGDVIDVKTSLGSAGRRLFIEVLTGGALEIRINVLHKLYQNRGVNDGLTEWGGESRPNLTTEVEFTSGDPAVISLSAGETFELNGDLPINDVHFATITGDFEMIVY